MSQAFQPRSRVVVLAAKTDADASSGHPMQASSSDPLVLNNPGTGVFMSVDASLMALRILEPPFQLQIVLRDIHIVTSGE